jgi:hypothetical protein
MREEETVGALCGLVIGGFALGLAPFFGSTGRHSGIVS